MLGDPDPKAKSEINSIMNNTIDGWERGPTHRFGGAYGTQRSWQRVNRVKRKYEIEGGKRPCEIRLKNVFGLVYVFVYKAKPIDYPCFVGQLVSLGMNPQRGRYGG